MMAARLKNQQTLGEFIGENIPAEHRDLMVSGLSLNSGSINAGDAFLACDGGSHHGLDFAAEAVQSGASVVLYEPRDGEADLLPHRVPFIRIDDLSKRAGQIANRFYGAPSENMTVAGITGTNGKTTTSRLIAAAGMHAGLVTGMSGTLGYGFADALQPTALTTPDAIAVHRQLAEMRDQGASHVAMEVSSHALDQHRVEGMTFDTAVFTNLSRDHLDYHGDMQSYLATKRLLFAWPKLRRAVVNVDDAAGAELARDIQHSVPVIAVGHRDAVLGFESVCIAELNTSPAGIQIAVTTTDGEGQIRSPLLGDFNGTNIVLALAVLLGWEVDLDAACAALESVQTVPGRMESFGGGDAPLVVVDYAHTPDALENALRALRKHCMRDLWVVFGCGGGRDRGKRPMMGEIAARLADQVVITDDNPRDEDPQAIIAEIQEGTSGGNHIHIHPGRRAAIARAVAAAGPGDVVLLAGKGHEDYQLIGDERLSLSDCEEAKSLVGERK